MPSLIQIMTGLSNITCFQSVITFMREFFVFGTEVEKDILSLQECYSSPGVLSIALVTRKLHVSLWQKVT